MVNVYMSIGWIWRLDQNASFMELIRSGWAPWTRNGK